MEQTRWLTPREERVWRLFATLLVRLPDEIEAQLQRDAGLTHFGYGVLSTLSETPGRALRMSELAYMAQGSRSRLSHLITNLERRGWVRRERATADGRGNLAILTDAGYETVVAIAPSHVATVRTAIFYALSPQQLDELEGICTVLLDPEIRDKQLRRLSPPDGRNQGRHHSDDATVCPQVEDAIARAEDVRVSDRERPVTNEDLTAGLTLISDARGAIDLTELQLIDQARAHGHTWEQIAAALGMPDRRQAQTRFRRLRERWPDYEPISATSRKTAATE
jgi:DNA-binding MarR family transcriptional regulator